MATANEFDTGRGVWSNFWNDIKHIPERRIQESRQMRAQAQYQAIRDQAQQAEIQKKLDDEALSRWQKAYGDRPAPMTENGRLNRATMNGMLRQFEEMNDTDQAVKKTYALGDARRNLELSEGAEDVLGASVAPEQIGRERKAAQQAPATAGAPAAPQPGPFAGIGQRIRQAMDQQDLAKREQARREAAAIATEQARVRTQEDERTAFRAAFGRDPGAGDVDPQGQLNAASLKSVADHKEKGKLTQTQRNAEYAVDQAIKAGAVPEEQREEAIAVFSQQIMGRAPQFPQSEREMALGNAKYIQQLDALRSSVGKVPKGGFGPIDNRLGLLTNRLFGVNQDLATVDQDYKAAASAKAFGEGGKALTETEKEMTFGQLGDPNSESFPQQLTHHYEQARNVVSLQLERLKQSPYRFTSEGQAAIRQLEQALAGLNPGTKPAADPSVDDLVAKYTK